MNKCGIPIWYAIASKVGAPPIEPTTTGFILQKNESKTVTLAYGWEGYMWGRTHCFTALDGHTFTCVTGNCASGTVDCAGAGATPPVTLANFTFRPDTGSHSYTLSVAYGYNVPMLVSPKGGRGVNCADVECTMDFDTCPAQLKVSGSDGIVACQSACGAFGLQEYCCTGAYNTRDTCTPSEYSKQFKKACPRAHTYAYDDVDSIFTCSGADYQVTFCPTITNSDSGEPQTLVDNGADANTGSAKPRHKNKQRWKVILGSCIGGVVGLVLTGAALYFAIACCNKTQNQTVNNQTVNNPMVNNFYGTGSVNIEMPNLQNQTVNH